MRPQLHPLMFVGYCTVFLASLFGNSVVIHIIRTDKSMRTTTNYLIINQACADLLISLTEIIAVFYYSSYGSVWIGGILGLIYCKMFIAMSFISTHFSVWILAIIAVDRFYAVTRPLRLSPISQHLKKIILLCWAWSLPFLRITLRKKPSQLLKDLVSMMKRLYFMIRIHLILFLLHATFFCLFQ